MKAFFLLVIVVLFFMTYSCCCTVVLLGETCKQVRIVLPALLPDSEPVCRVVRDMADNLLRLPHHSVFNLFNLILASFDWVFFQSLLILGLIRVITRGYHAKLSWGYLLCLILKWSICFYARTL